MPLASPLLVQRREHRAREPPVIHERLWRRVLRTVAVLIALVAAIDPAIVTTRQTDALVAAVPADAARDSIEAVRVARELSKYVRVVSSVFGKSDATLLVGDVVPISLPDITQPTFALLHDSDSVALIVTGFDVASRASLHQRIPVRISIRVLGSAGRAVTVTLRANQLTVDSTTFTIASPDTLVRASLSAVASAAGALSLRAVASIRPASPATIEYADALVAITDTPREVLVYDPRPSWMSTFVRRALAHSPRVRVTARVATSTSVSTAFGTPPAALDDASQLERFDAVVVAAPEMLTANAVRALDTFMRDRGGSVLLLFDQLNGNQSGSIALDRLTGVHVWERIGTAEPLRLATSVGDSTTLLATELAWPAQSVGRITLLAGAKRGQSNTSPRGTIDSNDTINKRDARGSTSSNRAVIWSVAQGAGQLIVSTAFDAWRFRDSTRSSFGAFFRAVVADAAERAPPPLELSVARNVLRAGDEGELSVTVRDAAYSSTTSRNPDARSSSLPNSDVRGSASFTTSAMLVADSAGAFQPMAIRLWPDGVRGTFRGTFRAPHTIAASPQTAHIAVRINQLNATVRIRIDSSARQQTLYEPALLRAWATAHGGVAMSRPQLPALTAELLRRVRAPRRDERWHPMRTPWWLLPFGVALSLEWWLRRRHGLS